MKRIILILTITLLSMTALPVLAGQPLPVDPTLTGRSTAEPPGEFIIIDVLFLRPLGLASMAVGAGTAALIRPWSESSNSEDRVQKELLQKPYWYTFRRPLGDIDF
ncbi:MAG TPA: hypothetical protein HPP57_05955 [Deltaproteobacteria bacterium]|jgi:hypothetical protein|nr:hypothetical protein [Deltaproteobacteria bacterium]